MDEIDLSPTSIDGNIFLGGLESTSAKTLKTFDIKRIVTVDIRPLSGDLTQSVLFIKANDFQYEDLLSRFEECYQFIKAGVDSNERVLIHCVAGVSRSATILCAYFMREKSMSAQEAIDFVRKKRSIIDPNEGFVRQLNLFAKMNRRIDSTNAEYRKLLLIHLKFKMSSFRPWRNQSPLSEMQPIQEPLGGYFSKLNQFLPKNKLKAQKHEDVFKCKKCRLFLFNSINVVKVDDCDADLNLCTHIFIEPQKWMLPYINNHEVGPINCSHCFTKIGSFDWNGFVCTCKLHSGLLCGLFRVDAKKVDSPSLKVP